MAEEPISDAEKSVNARHETPRGAIAWMARNHVAANLLMILFIVGGLGFATQVKQEVFPEFEIDSISVSVPYPGASPEEVEQGILLSIEDSVRGLDGVKEVTSTANEGSGFVAIELQVTADRGKALQDVKNAIDRIRSFPEEAERPTVSISQVRNRVVSLIVSGDVDRRTLRELAERIRDDLLSRDGITLVELGAVPRLEIAIEVPDRELRALGLTLGDIAQTVRASAVELPAGAVKTDGGEVLLRTQERRDFGMEFADIPVATTPDGTRVMLGDVARIVDGFEDTDEETLFNGLPAVRVDVYRVGDETPISVSDTVVDYVREVGPTLPAGIELVSWDDRSEAFRDRMQLLLKNAFIGLVLVLLLLGLFLEPRLAFWVTLGIPISILGAFLFLHFTGASINMISLFAFIITLGIIVDDAVVMGENIFARREEGMSTMQAAMYGAREIAPPITFAVLTNIAAFMPLLFVPGSSGKLFGQIPSVTIAVFIVSLIESLFILPAHLSHRGTDTLFWRVLGTPSRIFGAGLDWVIRRIYGPSLRIMLHWRYATVAGGLAMLILCGALVGAGAIKFNFLPRIDSDSITVRATLPFGSPVEQSREIQARLVAAAQATIAEVADEEGRTPETLVEGIVTTIGSFPSGGGPGSAGGAGGGGAHLVGVQVALVPSGDRQIGGVAFAERWRQAAGAIPGLESISFRAEIGAGGEALNVELSHRDVAVLDRAAADLAATIGTYAGVFDIDDGVAAGKPQLDFTIRPEARSLGITASEIAQQLRASFFGVEALRQQRGRNEVRVMVRLPESERRTLNTLEQLMLRPRGGGELPLGEAVDVVEGRSYTQITRVDGRRTKSVSADVQEDAANAQEIVTDLTVEELPALIARYPGLSYRFAGEQDERRDSLGSLAIGFPLAMLVIYALLAVPFRSYVQPLLVMTAIPFGAIGAVLGHYLLGYGLSIISMFGIIALAGVVVNDSLVLVYTANRLRLRADAAGGAGMTADQASHGLGPFDAIMEASQRRFRPILLTSLTTFFGLAPMIFETSVQARFLIPMAISLGFGILFATVIILGLLPALYLVLEDFLGAIRRFVHHAEGRTAEGEAMPPATSGGGGGGGLATARRQSPNEG
jgi:multidrug efflux pump subunit AcrB